MRATATNAVVRRVDAHAHLDKYPAAAVGDVLRTIEQLGILTFSVSVDPTSYDRARELAEQCSLVIATFGIQPWEASSHRGRMQQILRCSTHSPMLGEIGLDRRFVTDPGSWVAQEEVFAALLDVAARQRKVVNVHSTGAEERTSTMLHDSGADRVIMHWYVGAEPLMRTMLDRGYLFSFGAAVRHDAHVQRLVAVVPDDQLLLETDNPGAERWFTGVQGQPGLLCDVEVAVAAIRRTAPERIRASCNANTLTLLLDDPHLATWRPVLLTLQAPVTP